MCLRRTFEPDKIGEGISLDNNQRVLEYIVKCIEETGSNPRDQIRGYVSSGDERYITRNGDARRLIKSLEIILLKQYITDFSA